MLYNKLAHEAQGAMKTQVPAILYKNNPRFTFPAQKQLESYQIKEVRDWVDAPLKNNYMEVTVTGDFKPEDIIPMLERTVGALPKRADAPAALDEKLRHPAMADFNFSRDLEYDSSIDKTLVCLFWKTPGGEDKKLARRLNMLKAVFYDRVFKGIREDMGETLFPLHRHQHQRNLPGRRLHLHHQLRRHAQQGRRPQRHCQNRDRTRQGEHNAGGTGPGAQPHPQFHGARPARQRLLDGLLKDSQAKPDRLAQQRESIPDVKAITVDEVNKLARDIFGKGDHLNLNILPDHPATEAPPAEKQADKSEKAPAAVSTAAFWHSRHCRKRR